VTVTADVVLGPGNSYTGRRAGAASGPGGFFAHLPFGSRSVTRLLSAEPRAASPVSGLHGRLFAVSMLAFVGLFVFALLAIFCADIGYTNWQAMSEVLRAPEIRAALWLSLWTSAAAVAIGLLFAVPMGYALSRYRFPGHAVVDSIVDLPIVLPPLVVGLSLLVFFYQSSLGRWIHAAGLEFAFRPKGIILCQFLVSASFGIRAVKLTFDGIDPRIEHVAMTLGCTRAGAFFRVALPIARRGIIVGGILIWTRAFGIFGPLMIFVGTVRMRTEVLPTTIFLEQSVGHIEVALAVAILMLVLAALALVTVRIVGLGQR
jgi:molybdate transport system permease protein